MGVQRDVIPLAEGERGGQRPPEQQSGQQSVSGRTPCLTLPRLARQNNSGVIYIFLRRYFNGKQLLRRFG